MSAREVQRTHHVTWRTVKAAAESAWPAGRAAYPQRGSKLDAFKPVIDEMLRADLDAPRKQRHTATRIFDRLVDEHGMRDVSYAMVRAYVADRRPEIRVEEGRGPRRCSSRRPTCRAGRPRSTSGTSRSGCAASW